MNDLQKIAHYGKLLHEKDLVIGAGGNLSSRSGTSMIIKRKGTSLAEGRTECFIKIPFDDIKGPSCDLISSESPFHITCYKTSPSIGAVIHVHSPFVIAAASKFNILASPSYEFDCILGQNIPIVDYLAPGSEDLAEAIGAIVQQGVPAVLLKKHGSVTVGQDLEEAFLRTLALERACKTILHSA